MITHLKMCKSNMAVYTASERIQITTEAVICTTILSQNG